MNSFASPCATAALNPYNYFFTVVAYRQILPMDPSTIVPIFIGIVAVLVIGITIFSIIKAIAQWQHNTTQPILSVASRVVAKRTRVRGHVSPDRGGRTITYYYCTFEDERGQRHEFRLSGKEYGQLVEGDLGTLTYQGTRYHGFQRQIR